MDNDYIVDENISLLNSFFLNDSYLVHLYPYAQNVGNLIIELNNYKNIKDFETKLIYDESLTKKHEIVLNKLTGHKIKQISTQLIPEFESEGEFMINICVNGTQVKTVSSVLSNTNSNWDDVELDSKVIESKEFNKQYIHSLASSPHIYGECLFIFGDKNEIVLRTVNNEGNFDYQSVCQDIFPNFESSSNWRNVLFGNHPRNVVYSDYSKICCIDTRLKPSNTNEIFSINSEISKKFLNINEVIERNVFTKNDFNAHIICCTNTLLIVDERFTSRPLITWKHHLNLKPIHLQTITLNNTNNNIILCSDATDIFAYQFNLNENSMPISYSFPLKIDTLYSDFETHLPEGYDKRLKRHFSWRLKQPILSMSTVNDNDKFAIFQMPSNTDLYYQMFEANNNMMEVEKSYEMEIHSSNYDTWLGKLRFNYLVKIEILKILKLLLIFLLLIIK